MLSKQTVPHATKFRDKELEHDYLLNALYKCTIAIGEPAYAPPQGLLLNNSTGPYQYRLNNPIDNNDDNLGEPFVDNQGLNDIGDSRVSNLRHDYVSNGN